MLEVMAILCLVMAVFALTWGVTTEYRQSREDGPVAIVPTLPFGVSAALLATMGMALLVGDGIPVWAYLIIFVGLAALGCFAITRATARRQP